MLLSVLLQAASVSLGTAAIALGVAFTVFAAAFGIGKIGTSAMEGIARQPDAADNIRTSMIIVAAFIEGAALFAIVVLGFIL